MRKGLWLAAFVLALFASVAPVAAAPILIDFAGQGAQGTIIRNINEFTGSNILIDSMLVEGGTSPGIYAVTNGYLEFAYGGAENYIRVYGAVAGIGIDQSIQLLNGSFTSFVFTPAGAIGSVSGGGPDVKNPILLRSLGIPADTVFNFYGFTLGPLVDGAANTWVPRSTDIINTTPDPGSSLLLLGLGLVGLSMWRKR